MYPCGKQFYVAPPDNICFVDLVLGLNLLWHFSHWKYKEEYAPFLEQILDECFELILNNSVSSVCSSQKRFGFSFWKHVIRWGRWREYLIDGWHTLSNFISQSNYIKQIVRISSTISKFHLKTKIKFHLKTQIKFCHKAQTQFQPKSNLKSNLRFISCCWLLVWQQNCEMKTYVDEKIVLPNIEKNKKTKNVLLNLFNTQKKILTKEKNEILYDTNTNFF